MARGRVLTAAASGRSGASDMRANGRTAKPEAPRLVGPRLSVNTGPSRDRRRQRLSRRRFAGAKNRTRVYALAGDGRQAIIARTAQDHSDRVAAPQRHFGQQVTGRGDPDATHAQSWLAGLEVDEYRARPQPPPVFSFRPYTRGQPPGTTARPGYGAKIIQ